MANNDPIKDYNEVNLKIDRLKEKMEMYVGYDEQVTDLHDCSNDLSDKGSKKEEYEHAKYAEKIRQKMNINSNNTKTGFDAWSQQKKTSNNTSVIIVIVIFIIFCVFSGIAEIIEEFVSLFENSYDSFYVEDYDNETNISQFQAYTENIETSIITANQNETYVEIYNSNAESYENLKLEAIFYDEYEEVIETKFIYINILLGNNYHYFEIPDAPVNYDSYEINILDNYGEYTSISKDDFIVEFKNEYVGYNEDNILLTSNCYEDLNHLEVKAVYSNPNGEISFKSADFYDIDWGDVKQNDIYSYGIEDENAEMIMVTINDLY